MRRSRRQLRQIARNTLPSPPVPHRKMTLPDPKQKPRTPPKPTASSKIRKERQSARGRGTGRHRTGRNRRQGPRVRPVERRRWRDGGVKLGTRLLLPGIHHRHANRITKNWNQQQQSTGIVVMQYTIQRNGQITDIEVETSSGNPILDLASQRALINTGMLAPLPAAFPGSATGPSDVRVHQNRAIMKNLVRNFCIAAYLRRCRRWFSRRRLRRASTHAVPARDSDCCNHAASRGRSPTTPCRISSR